MIRQSNYKKFEIHIESSNRVKKTIEVVAVVLWIIFVRNKRNKTDSSIERSFMQK